MTNNKSKTQKFLTQAFFFFALTIVAVVLGKLAFYIIVKPKLVGLKQELTQFAHSRLISNDNILWSKITIPDYESFFFYGEGKRGSARFTEQPSLRKLGFIGFEYDFRFSKEEMSRLSDPNYKSSLLKRYIRDDYKIQKEVISGPYGMSVYWAIDKKSLPLEVVDSINFLKEIRGKVKVFLLFGGLGALIIPPLYFLAKSFMGQSVFPMLGVFIVFFSLSVMITLACLKIFKGLFVINTFKRLYLLFFCTYLIFVFVWTYYLLALMRGT